MGVSDKKEGNDMHAGICCKLELEVPITIFFSA